MPSKLEEMLEMGASLYGAGQSQAAARLYRDALKIAPADPTVRLRLALAKWHGENRSEEALDDLQDLARTHAHPDVWAAEALILLSLGRFAQARDAARRTVDADPDKADSWLDLATATEAEGAEALLAEVGARIAAVGPEDKGLRRLHLARAQLLRKLGRDDEAFDATAAANAAFRPSNDSDHERRFFRELRKVFTPDFMRLRLGDGHPDERMIFIVGMPRSGTTLLERMLAAHADVETLGETSTVGSIFFMLRRKFGGSHRQIRAALTPENLRSMADSYLTAMRGRLRAETATRVIDKMPVNHTFAPLIRLMFPYATILHARRHPLDTCLSCWEAGFAFDLDFAARFDTMGQTYRRYVGLWERWSELPGLDVHDVVYEHLVTDAETVMRRVLDAARLPWDPACLAPASGGQIKTASVAQAREAANPRSIGRWRRFENRLGPLVAALGGMAWIDAHDPARAGKAPALRPEEAGAVPDTP